MTQEELEKEVERLNGRLQKATTVFTEQKATIQRLTEERDAALAKAAQGEEQDQMFFDQQQEIDDLKAKIECKDKAYENLQDSYNQVVASDKEKGEEIEKLNGRIEKAGDAYTKLKSEHKATQEELEQVTQKLNTIREVLG